MKYLILILIPTLSFANYRTENGNVTYAKKQVCEKKEAEECYKVPLEIADIASLKKVDVDDTSKPIYEPRQLGDVQRIDENGEPVLDDDGNPIIDKVCTFTLIDESCVELVGYKQKKEKRFIVDAAKVAAKEAKKQKEQAKEQSCEQFKTLLDDSAIDAQSNPSDIKEVVRRLLGYYRACIGG